MNATHSKHQDRAHALLSASSAGRWLTCPPSARLTESAPDGRSSFAAYGTAMHELAEKAFLSDSQAYEVEGLYDQEQRDAVQVYLDYVRALPGTRLIEQRLSYDRWVKEGFGTCDAVVLADRCMTVIDLKGGIGVFVSANDNPQLKLYALAAYDAYNALWGPLDRVTLVIVQPRLENISSWDISTEALLRWAEDHVRPRAELAWSGRGELTPSDECRFCLARFTCKARAEYNLATAAFDFAGAPKGVPEAGDGCPPGLLSLAEIAALLPRLDALKKWATEVQDYALKQALEGKRIENFKLVEGRSNRRYGDPDAVAAKLLSCGLNESQIYERSLLTITALEKVLGKKKFAELLADLVFKPQGAPVLVPASDPRNELNSLATAVADFS